MQSGQLLVSGSDFYCGNSKLNPCQLALNSSVESLKTSVSEGKSLIAAAVTDKGVKTAADSTFQVIANNINDISKLPNGVTVERRTFSVSTGISNTATTTWYGADLGKESRLPIYIVTRSATVNCAIHYYPSISIGVSENNGNPKIRLFANGTNGAIIYKYSNDGVSVTFKGEYDIYFATDATIALSKNATSYWNSVESSMK